MQSNRKTTMLKNILYTETSPIGFFDSGVGGLSIYAEFKKILPKENTLYYGDLLHLPYGNKSKEELINYARFILDFYKKQKVKAVVIACNTSSAQAYESIKDDYNFKIYPIIQCCAKIIAMQNYKKIGVFATQSTVNSKVYTTEIQKYSPQKIIKEIACPNWVNIVETNSNNFSDIKKHMDEMLEFNPEKVVLGCTHYPFLINELKKYAPEDFFINPAKIFVNYIYDDLRNSNLLNQITTKGTEKFFVSSNIDKFKHNAVLFYPINTSVDLITENVEISDRLESACLNC